MNTILERTNMLFDLGARKPWEGLPRAVRGYAEYLSEDIGKRIADAGMPNLTEFVRGIESGAVRLKEDHPIFASLRRLHELVETGRLETSWEQLAEVQRIDVGGYVTAIAGVLPNGDIIADRVDANNDPQAIVIDGKTDQIRQPTQKRGGVLGVLPTTGVIVKRPELHIWYPSTGNAVDLGITGNYSAVWNAATSSQFIVRAGGDVFAKLFTVGQTAKTVRLPDQVGSVYGVTPDGYWVTDETNEQAIFFSKELSGGWLSYVDHQAFQSAGETTATLVGGGGVVTRGDATVWYLGEARRPMKLEGTQYAGESSFPLLVASHPDNPRFLALVDRDHRHKSALSIIDAANGRLIRRYELPDPRYIGAFAVSGDGKILLSSGSTIHIFG